MNSINRNWPTPIEGTLAMLKVCIEGVRQVVGDGRNLILELVGGQNWSSFVQMTVHCLFKCCSSRCSSSSKDL